MELFIAGLATVGAILFLLFKVNIRKALGFDLFIDAGVSVLLVIMFAGTFSGMFVAAISAFIFSVALFALKRIIGYDRLTRKGWKHVRPNWAQSEIRRDHAHPFGPR